MIYTVTFNPAVDCNVTLHDLKVGTVNRCDTQNIYFGGKGVNVSFVLHTLDVPTCAWGFTAGFTGIALEEALTHDGVKNDFIRLPEGNTRINVKIMGAGDVEGVAAAGIETAINANSAKIDDASLQKLLEQLSTTEDGDIFVISGNAPKELPKDIYTQMIATQDGRDVRIVVDATGDLLLNTLPCHPFLIKPNDEEVGELLGIEKPTRDQLVEGAHMLQERGARNVLISRGGEGALLLDEFGTLHEDSALQGTLVNSVGAGDSMVAGFVAGYWRALEAGGTQETALEEAFMLAQACGSATAFSPSLAPRELVDELYNKLAARRAAN